MQRPTKVFDDFARVASGAASTFAGVREEVDALVRQQLERLLNDMDVVQRDEFDAMRDIALAARAENEELRQRVEALEKERAGPKKTTRTRKPSKPAESG